MYHHLRRISKDKSDGYLEDSESENKENGDCNIYASTHAGMTPLQPRTGLYNTWQQPSLSTSPVEFRIANNCMGGYECSSISPLRCHSVTYDDTDPNSAPVALGQSLGQYHLKHWSFNL